MASDSLDEFLDSLFSEPMFICRDHPINFPDEAPLREIKEKTKNHSICKRCRAIRLKQWKQNNREKFNTILKRCQRKIAKIDPARYLHENAKRRAKRRNLDFDLTIPCIESKLKENNYCCELTAIPFTCEFDIGIQRAPFNPSIDRIDSKKGYTKDNIRIVCWIVNQGLGDFGDEAFRTMCEAYTYRHQFLG